MKHATRLLLMLAALLAGTATPARALCRESTCAPDGRQDGGAVYRVCMPEPGCWNGDLVVFAHAYVEAGRPVAIPEEQLAIGDGLTLPALANRLGYAFATTSYRSNGLAILDGGADVQDLLRLFSARHGAPGRAYLVGASEGSVITALLLERDPEGFDAGVAACAPIGDLQAAIEYASDVRVVFDYFFPGVVPGSVADVPGVVRKDWDAVYAPRVRTVLEGDPGRLAEFLAVTNMAVDPDASHEDVLAWVEGLVWFATFASDDAAARLGGSPYGNRRRVYRGSRDDGALNRGIGRHVADPGAVAEIAAHYETSGRLSRPLVTLHSRFDPTVPYRQVRQFARKVRSEGATALYGHVAGDRFGHCVFDLGETLLAFAKMVRLAGAELSPELQQALEGPDARERIARRLRARRP